MLIGGKDKGGTRARRILALAVIGVLVLALDLGMQPAPVDRGSAGPVAAGGGQSGISSAQPGSDSGRAGAVTAVRGGVQVGRSLKNDRSRPLRDIQPRSAPTGMMLDEERTPPVLPGHRDGVDPVVQRGHQAAPTGAQSAGVDFAGMDSGGSGCSCLPPDPNGDVGLNQYVQMVNGAFQIFTKRGQSVYGPAAINTLWDGFGGACEHNNHGDPIVLYDAIANRWLLSQFTFSSPYTECIAISTNDDATDSWYRYAFLLSTSDLQDYPHLGVWPDGYYMSTIQFSNGSTAAGPAPYVFERAKMLVGQAATFQTLPALGPAEGPLLPADLDGMTLPTPGAPNYFAQLGETLHIYGFHVDWTVPANTTFTPAADLRIADFTQLCPTTRSCIPQRGTGRKLDGLGDRLMFRLAYRNFGDHDTLVVNHSVSVGPGNQAGVRWYEVRNPGTSPLLFQQGTFAPDDDSRWMGSAAMDKFGDLAIGYSVAGRDTFPSIRYAVRTPRDAPGTLSNETVLVAGHGSQTNLSNRWGDYSDLVVDPVDDCTFWYTQEYYAATSDAAWATRIGSFRLARCTMLPDLWLPMIGR